MYSIKKYSAAILPAFSLILMVLSGCVRTHELSFNNGWKFVRDSLVGAEAVLYDDSDWKTVTLPHDFSVEPLPEGEYTLGPFSRESVGGGSMAYLSGGTGWYRKDFRLSRSDAGKSVRLVFDGAYMLTDVWVNGHHAASHKNGYTPFSFDITDYLLPAGEDNVLAVRVVNYGRNTRWYSGSGLYRGVDLIVSDPLHIAQWGTCVTTPDVTADNAQIRLDIDVENDGVQAVDAELKVRIIDPEGAEAARKSVPLSVPGSASGVVSAELSVEEPSLWTPDTPSLYTAEIQLIKGGRQTDIISERFGIRTIEVNARDGFKLNGETVLLKGGCIHHDNGLLGAAAFRSAEYRRVRLLKASGFNAVRCAHNPPSRYFLDACDELGLLVIDEFTDMWELSKTDNDYSQYFGDNWENDLTAMLLRDRNHPSVVIWSIGNEIPNWSIAEASRLGKMLTAKVRGIDPTRPVTQGVTSAFIHLDWDNSVKTFEHLDIAGYNYLTHYLEGDHAKYPDRVIMGTESYPNQAWTYWQDVLNKPYVIGDFVWTALDHLGESGMGVPYYMPAASVKDDKPQFQISKGPEEGFNPAVMWRPPYGLGPELPVVYNNFCGDIDLIGDKKPQGRYRDVMWDVSPLEILVHEPVPEGMKEQMGLWGWPAEESRWYWPGHEGERLRVRVFSKAPQVRLELNGETVGVQSTNEEHVALFEDVEYRPGRLRAVSLDIDDRELDERVLVTPGRAAAVCLACEPVNDGDELLFIKAEVVDENGVVVPEAFPLTFEIKGASFISAGNGSPDDMRSFGSLTPFTWRGAALLIVRPDKPGSQVEVSAGSEGLRSGRVGLQIL